MAANKGRWRLTQDSYQLVISAPAEHIYDLVADMPRMGEWSPECQLVEWEEGATGPAPDARFVGHNRGGPRQLMRWTRHGRVLVADRGQEFAFITEEGGREGVVWRYQFEPVQGGTRVTESYEVKWIPTWARILDVPTNRHRELQAGMRHTLGQLKGAAEAVAPAAGVPLDAVAEPVFGDGNRGHEVAKAELDWFRRMSRTEPLQLRLPVLGGE